MEPTGLVYVTITLGGILLVSPKPVTVEECNALHDTQTTVLCIDQEPDCGKHAGKEPCLGTALAEEKPDVVKKKRKPTVHRKRIRRSSTTPVADLVRRAMS